MSLSINSKNTTHPVGIATQESSCIAWFKLAELITRREKEKALSLYRLLAHSFEDKAYVLQIEGDILWSLEDNQALEKYQQAAFLYKKEKNIINAIAIYEHLLILQPLNYDYLSTLIISYVLISWTEKFEERYKLFLAQLDKKIINEEQVVGFTKKLIDLINEEDIPEKDKFLKTLMSMLEKKNQKLVERVSQS